MIKILYDEKDFLKIIKKIPKDKRFIILDYEEYKLNGDKDFIYIYNGNDNILDNLKDKTVVIDFKNKVSFRNKYRNLYFTNSIEFKYPKNENIKLYGSLEDKIEVLKFISNYYNTSIRVIADSWQKEYMMRNDVLNKIQLFSTQLDFNKTANINVIFDETYNDFDISIILWRFSIDTLYYYKEHFKNTSIDKIHLILYDRSRIETILKVWDVNIYKKKNAIRSLFENM